MKTSLDLASTKKELAPKSLRLRLARLAPFFARRKAPWIAALIATAISASTEPLIPAALQPLLDKGFQKGALPVWAIPVAILILFAIRGISGYIAELSMARITSQGLKDLRSAMFSKLLSADLQLFEKQNASELSNTLVYEVQNGSQQLVGALLNLVKDSVTLLALIVYLLILNWKLTAFVALMLPAIAWIMSKLSKRLYALTKNSQKATDALAYVVEENVLAQRDIRLHNAQNLQHNRFSIISEQLRALSIKAVRASAAMKPLTQMMAAIALSGVITVALLQSANGATTVGQFTAFVTAMLLLVAPIKHLSEVANPLTRGLAALERGFDLIDNTPDEVQNRQTVQKPTILPIDFGATGNDIDKKDVISQINPVKTSLQPTHLLNLKDVSVSYANSKQDNYALNGINLTIDKGQTLALVGASGSGKSTLVNLLARFIALTRGSIALNDKDIQTWDLQQLRAQFAYVSQHVVMLSDTVARNVALGVPDENIDIARVWHCLTAAQLKPVIETLPQGLDSTLGHNATQLSGGQRQRLAIARALYKDAPILILDEATSALDTESERAIQSALTTLMQGRTTIVIAHRLSTVEHADTIAVLDKGSIVECGNHAQLLALNGTYARLYRLGLHES